MQRLAEILRPPDDMAADRRVHSPRQHAVCETRCNLKARVRSAAVERYRASCRTNVRCQRCLDQGYVMIAGRIEYCPQCRAEESAQALWQASGLCDLDRQYSFFSIEASPPFQEALDAALAMARGQAPPFLLLLGAPGRGKTHLATAICLYRLSKGQPARFCVVPQMLSWLRAGYDGGDYDSRLRGVLYWPLLVLDDLGMEYSTAWVEEQLDLIIAHRNSHELATVVTANPELLERRRDRHGQPAPISERIRSRIQNLRKSVVVSLDECEDYRLTP